MRYWCEPAYGKFLRPFWCWCSGSSLPFSMVDCVEARLIGSAPLFQQKLWTFCDVRWCWLMSCWSAGWSWLKGSPCFFFFKRGENQPAWELFKWHQLIILIELGWCEEACWRMSTTHTHIKIGIYISISIKESKATSLFRTKTSIETRNVRTQYQSNTLRASNELNSVGDSALRTEWEPSDTKDQSQSPI